ncbi:MAG: 2OG-Fe(II) oxygenase family protein [Novosphingobium sp.]
MTGAAIPLFEINPALDRAGLAAAFARDGCVQVGDVLTERTAREIRRILAEETPWGLSWQAGTALPPEHVRPQAMAARTPAERAAIGEALARAMAGSDYGFAYGAYPMVDAYQQRWDPGHPLDLVLEHLNDAPFLDLARAITGLPALVKADAQATLYGPGQFLARHSDSHVGEGWRVAYVLHLTAAEWRPEWGGHLVFFDEAGDVTGGFRPRFNSLNLFTVPRWHAVTYVPPFAPVGRYAITGWLRDR